jgi:hypothetical protein
MIEDILKKIIIKVYTVFYFLVLLIVKYLELLRFNYINITNPELLLRGSSPTLGASDVGSIRTIKNKLTEFVCKTKSSMNLALQKSQIQNNLSSRT